jgi:hypothetical protein
MTKGSIGEFIASAGGRKFLLTLSLIVVFTIFVVLDKMTVNQFLYAVLTDLGIFSAANAASDFAK